MGNGLRDQIKEIIMDEVYCTRLTYSDGDFVFTYEGVGKAADLIVAKVLDRLDWIDCG